MSRKPTDIYIYLTFTVIQVCNVELEKNILWLNIYNSDVIIYISYVDPIIQLNNTEIVTQEEGTYVVTCAVLSNVPEGLAENISVSITVNFTELASKNYCSCKESTK